MLEQYREVVLADFEFIPDGERITRVVCLVAHLLKSGTTIRLWKDQFGPTPPYPIGDDTLFVAFAATAEVGCHLALGWPAPARVLDLYTEYLARINMFREKGTEPPAANLLAALTAFGLDTIGASEKENAKAHSQRWPVDRATAPRHLGLLRE
jgi:DNA polymerase-1